MTTQGLGLKAYHVAGTDFVPRIEYNAKSGRLSVVNKKEGPEGEAFATVKTDVTHLLPEFALDIGSIEIGWIHFPAGLAPDGLLVPFGQPMPPRPSSRHKAGFLVRVWNGTEPESREFKSTAGVVVDAIEALWDEIAATPYAPRGDIPIVKFHGAVPVPGKHGTNYQPDLQMTGQWITRDDRLFGARTVPSPQPPRNGNATAVAAPPHTPQNPPIAWQAPPAPTPAPQATRAW